MKNFYIFKNNKRPLIYFLFQTFNKISYLFIKINLNPKIKQLKRKDSQGFGSRFYRVNNKKIVGKKW